MGPYFLQKIHLLFLLQFITSQLIFFYIYFCFLFIHYHKYSFLIFPKTLPFLITINLSIRMQSNQVEIFTSIDLSSYFSNFFGNYHIKEFINQTNHQPQKALSSILIFTPSDLEWQTSQFSFFSTSWCCSDCFLKFFSSLFCTNSEIIFSKVPYFWRAFWWWVRHCSGDLVHPKKQHISKKIFLSLRTLSCQKDFRFSFKKSTQPLFSSTDQFLLLSWEEAVYGVVGIFQFLSDLDLSLVLKEWSGRSESQRSIKKNYMLQREIIEQNIVMSFVLYNHNSKFSNIIQDKD